ncbi:MAG: hypothetical protein M1827_000198 [Pycnora praestabilis]|nr:MAG: hypothetical protein M1827_000198 [Pycnora praestabilis]
MHSTLVRAQNVFGFFTTVAFFIAALVALSVIVSPQNPSARVKVKSVQVVKGRPHYYSQKKEEYAHIKFDLDADLSSLFNWNTKQLFVWVLATYPSLPSSHSPSTSSPNNTTTTTTPASSAIIWDQIIPSQPHLNPNMPASKRATSLPSQRGLITLRNQKPKYQITDISGKLAERGNVTLEVGWNVQPWVGALTWTTWRSWGMWAGLGEGGRSEIFGMPALKGKKTEGGAKG